MYCKPFYLGLGKSADTRLYDGKKRQRINIHCNNQVLYITKVHVQSAKVHVLEDIKNITW